MDMLERAAKAIRHGPIDPTGMGDSATSLDTILSDGDRIVGAACDDLARHCALNALEAALDPEDELLNGDIETRAEKYGGVHCSDCVTAVLKALREIASEATQGGPSS